MKTVRDLKIFLDGIPEYWEISLTTSDQLVCFYEDIDSEQTYITTRKFFEILNA